MNAETIQRKDWNENCWIKYESSGTSILEREREIFLSNEVLERVAEKILTREIKSQICKLEKQVQELKSDISEITVSDSAAKEFLKDAIKQFKDKGTKEIDIIDLHAKTKLPVLQIGKIMGQLEEEGVVTEYGEG